jgi:hypothetical protein
MTITTIINAGRTTPSRQRPRRLATPPDPLERAVERF